MNRKIFAALLIFPVAIFATDRLVSAPDGGGKEKAKTTQTTEQQTAQAGIAAPIQQQKVLKAQEHETVMKTQGTASANFDLMVTELAANLKRMEEGYESIWDRELQPVKYSKTLNSKASEQLTNLLTRLKKENPMTLNLERSFSRCGTGYNVYVPQEATEETNEAVMVYQSGCMDYVIAELRFDVAGSNIQAKISDEVGFVPINTFFKVLKEVKA